MVDQILDIAEETLVSRSTAHRPGVLFTAVIQGRVTEFPDVGGGNARGPRLRIPTVLEQPWGPIAAEA